MIRQNIFSFLFLFVIVFSNSTQAVADDALMLPKGISRIQIVTTSGWADGKYDSDGNRKSFRQLAETGLNDAGVPSEAPFIYNINSSGEFSFVRYDLYFDYGITDNFNIGLWTHYFDSSFSSQATLSKGLGWDMLGVEQQGGIEFAVDSVDNADISTSALGDTVFGFKHRLTGTNKSETRFAYLLGMRAPTGHVKDPQNSSDASVGDGQWDVGVWFNFDYQPLPQFFIGFHSRHEYQLEGSRDVQAPSNPNNTLSQNFQPGFYNYIEIEPQYTFIEEKFDWHIQSKLIYIDQGEEKRQSYNAATDSFTGGLKSVSDTDISSLTLELGVGVNLFKSKWPLIATLSYGSTLDGKNAFDVSYIQLWLEIFL